MRLTCIFLFLFSLPAAHAQAPAAVSPELQRAAEEFKLLTRNEGLRGDGPKVRSGPSIGSAYHGRIFYNLRNDLFDAVPHEVAQRGGTENLLRRHQYGFNVSGPVVLPKLYDGRRSTFFSVSFEGVKENIGRSYLRTVPIESQRQGDYNLVVDPAGVPLRIFDPTSTRLNPNYDPAQTVSEENLQFLRDPFPGNVMPSARIDPVALAALKYYPLPNANVGPFWRNNYFVQSPESNNASGMILKLDHSFLEKQRISGTVSFTNGLATTAKFIQNISDPGAPDRDYSNRRLALEHVYTISPQRINTATFEGLSDVNTNATEGEAVPASLGLKGVAGDTFPLFSLGSYLNMGRANPDARNARNSFLFTDALAIKAGRHNVRLLGQFVRQQVNSYVAQYPSGSFRFTPGLTSLPGIVNTGTAFGNFLLGTPDFVELNIVPSPSYFRGSRLIFAVTDNWEIRPGLNLSVSLRFENNGPRTERYDRQSSVNLTRVNPVNGLPGALSAAGVDGEARAFQPWTHFVEPGISMAWSPSGNRKSVLRAAYYRSYENQPIYSAQFGTQGFNSYQTLFSQNNQIDPAMKLSDGVPALPYALPDIRPEAANGTVADLIEPTGAMPTYQSSSLSYEHELPGSFVLTAALGTAWGRNLFLGNGGANPNAIHPDNLEYRDSLNFEAFRRQLRPYPQYLGFDVYSLWPEGKYRRNAGSARVEKRAAQGLTLNASYEYSRQWDDYSGPYAKQDYFNARNEWSLTAYNNPHRFSASFQYEIPVGSNRWLLSYSDWRRFLVDGWALSGIASVASGEPLALRAQFNNTGGVLQTVRVNVVEGVDPKVPDQGPEMWFNPAAFSQPDDFSMGNGPRTHPTLRGPSSQNYDLAVTKRFPIDAERSVEFNASAFNFLNMANWNDPDTIIGPESAPNVNAGKIIGSRGGRVIQLGLRVSF